MHDQRSILTVCTPIGDILGVCDVTVSLPHLLGGAGILQTCPLSLSLEEQSALRTSAEMVCQAIQNLDSEAAQ